MAGFAFMVASIMWAIYCIVGAVLEARESGNDEVL